MKYKVICLHDLFYFSYWFTSNFNIPVQQCLLPHHTHNTFQELIESVEKAYEEYPMDILVKVFITL
jgi:hypothetical protein